MCLKRQFWTLNLISRGSFRFFSAMICNVANKDFRSHTEPLFSQMKVMKFQDILEFESYICNMHHCVYARLPDSLLNMFTPLKSNGRNGNYLLKRYKGKYLDRFTSSYLPKIWNQVSIM